jgi:hypothetical protein
MASFYGVSFCWRAPRSRSRRRSHEWRANQLDLCPVSSGIESKREGTSKDSTDSTTLRLSYPWNQGSTVLFNGKRPGLFEGVGNVEASQKRRRVSTKPLLWAAVESGDPIAVERLIQLSHDCSERYQGWTCLMKAAEDGNEMIMGQLLLEHVDINAVNKNGRTAMSFAASPRFKWPTKIGALRLLLSIGADSSILDHEGYSAESRARKEYRWAAVDFFKQQRISGSRSSESCVAIRRRHHQSEDS